MSSLTIRVGVVALESGIEPDGFHAKLALEASREGREARPFAVVTEREEHGGLLLDNQSGPIGFLHAPRAIHGAHPRQIVPSHAQTGRFARRVAW